MIKYNNTNNASTTLTAWISPSSTTLIVENGDILPTAPFLLTLEHFDNEKVTVREIVKCIAKVGTILTIQRGAWTCVQDDTATPKAQNNTPHSFSVWDCASIYWTSEQVQDIQNEIEKKLNIDDFQAWTYVYGATSTWTDAYSITIPWTLTSYAVGQVFRFMADTENTWNATLNVNGIWEKEILKNHDQHLQSGDIEAGQIVEVAYDGTNFQMDSQIASVISLDDLSSLSYNDLTCYAWEEIHENDLIVTNGNSFNPDWADESTDVWGQTVNKYAIWFIGNGNRTSRFGVKSCVIEWFEPNSVTINVETDDNWKPSGTAIATSTSLDFLKSRTVFSTSTYELLHSDPKDSDDLCFIWPTDYWNWGSPWQRMALILSNSNRYYITAATSGFFIRYLYDYDGTTYFSSSYVIYCGAYNKGENIIIYASWTSYGSGKFCKFVLNGSKYVLIQESENISEDREVYPWLSPDWKMICFISWNNPYKLSLAVMSTPYDLSTIEIVNTETSVPSHYYRTNFIYTTEDKYVMYTNTTNNYYPKHTVFKINEDYSITSAYSIEWNSTNGIRGDRLDTSVCYDTNWDPVIFTHYYWYSSASNKWYYFSTLWKDFRHKPWVQYISFPSFATEYGKKYRLTIAPVVTWSVVDSIKIYDKEGEYYSECAVKDLNSWSNVSNKTPYIDSLCIKARYARKEKEWDIFSSVCGWFANWDFTELENVQYTFKWIKTGFTWLKSDTAYYSTWDWWIATDWAWTYVWKAANDTSLLVDIDTSKGRKNKDRTLSVDKTDTSTHEFSERVTRNERIYISWNGKVTIYRNWVINASFNLGSWSTTGISTFLFEWDTLRVTYGRYDSSYWCSATVSFS